jgi:hypothetical protein
VAIPGGGLMSDLIDAYARELDREPTDIACDDDDGDGAAGEGEGD